MKLTAICVAVNYDDYLRYALFNTKLVDRYIVVTTPESHSTKALCDEFGAECIMTPKVVEDGGVSRAKGINVALKTCNVEDWVIVTDSDILFTPEVINFIHTAPLYRHEIYGSRRVVAHTIAELEQYFLRGDTAVLNYIWQDGCLWDVDRLGAGVQGCFQLFSYAGQYYPEDFGVAGNEDRIFSKWWPIGQRERLPLPIIHLGPAFENWFTRKTPFFGHSEALFQFLKDNFGRDLTIKKLKEMFTMTEITQIDRIKVDLFDIMEKQNGLQTELQKLEQVKQHKLKELAVLRQQQLPAPTPTTEGLAPLANVLQPRV